MGQLISLRSVLMLHFQTWKICWTK